MATHLPIQAMLIIHHQVQAIRVTVQALPGPEMAGSFPGEDLPEAGMIAPAAVPIRVIRDRVIQVATREVHRIRSECV